MSATVSLLAQTEATFLTPPGVRIVLTTLLPDYETGEGRHNVKLVAEAETREAAEQVLGLVALRLRAALAEVEALSGAGVVGTEEQ